MPPPPHALISNTQSTDAGRWELPTSEAAIKDFLETLQRCKKDLFW